ncbi:hypothetical protein [Pilimelia columellifera]|uniref:Uncharacterized protein n=1 Tax=Pilimelia columellifera subsp. columellifera TaxID=706583 RepID=A0ABN3NWD7_9ACTN
MEDMTCGRPTKAGTPCWNRRISNRTAGCQNHATELERATEAAYWEGYRDGMRAGEEHGRQAARWEAERELREAEARETASRNHRERTPDGRQIVTVERGYAYAMPPGISVAVGDQVSIPAPYWHGSSAPPQRVTVTALGSSYTGSLVTAYPG